MKKFWQFLTNKADWVMFAVGVAFGLILNALVQLMINDVNNLLSELAPEIVGIVFTVLFIERFGKARQERQHIEELTARIHSRYNATALQALEEMRALYKNRLQWVDMDTYELRDKRLEEIKQTVWNRKGILVGKKLRGSQWQDANFYQTDLRGTDLSNANLLRADLVEVNLDGATVKDEQLASCDIMMGAIMPDGTRYNGQFNLPGDFVEAQKRNHDVKSPQSMADWYGVSVEDYLAGQKFWNDNNRLFKSRSNKYDSKDFNNQTLPDGNRGD